jgi:hypothetical protein
MTAWLSTLPAALVLVVLWLAPGLVTGRLIGLRGIPLCGAAPALSLTVVAGGAVVAPVVHLPWTVATLVLIVVASAVTAWGVGGLLRAYGHTPELSRDARSPWAGSGLLLVMTVVVGLLVAVPTIAAVGAPDELVDSPDAIFHLNRLRMYLDLGNGSSLLVGYPSAFHDLAALAHQATGASIEVLVNLTALSAAVVVWPLTLLALAWVVFRGNPAAVVGTGLAAAATTTFPTILLGWGVLWPNVVGQAALPGVAALAVLAVRRAEGPGVPWRRRLRQPAPAALVAGLPGLALGHPNAVIGLALFAMAGAVTVLVGRVVRGPQRWTPTVLLLLTMVVPLLAGVVLPRISAQFAAAAAYTWDVSASPGRATWVFLATAEQYRPLWGLLAFTLVGAVVLGRKGSARWLVTAYLACGVLYVVATSSNGPVAATLTGFWYSDRMRLAALGAVPGSLLAGAGFAAVAAAISTRLPRPLRLPFRGSVAVSVIAFAVATVGFTTQGRFDIIARYYHPEDPSQTILTATDRRDLLGLVKDIPLDVMVLGDPSNGSGLLYALTGRPVLMQSIGVSKDPRVVLVGEHLKELATRSDVCTALAALRASYVVDSSRDYWGREADATSGLVGIAGAPGFTKVAQAGRYTLYAVTGCPEPAAR